MLKKTIEYTDFNGVERKEDFYFNLTNAELREMQLGTTGGYSEWVERIVAAQDIPTLSTIFKEIILKSYGVKSEDGRRFIKNEEVRAAFEQTEAYSVLYMELTDDAKKAAEFLNGIVPDKVAKAMEEKAPVAMINQ